MSNPSLKEQLQALVPTSPASEQKPEHSKHSAKANTNRPPRTLAPKALAPKQKPPKPAWLEYVHYGVELLKAHYPQCFKEPGEIQPLKVGIKQDLVKHLSTREDIVIADKSCMIKSLSYYVTTLGYFKIVLEGSSRIDLEGQAVGTVTAEEARYSAEQLKAKLQKKLGRPANKHQDKTQDPAPAR